MPRCRVERPCLGENVGLLVATNFGQKMKDLVKK